MISLSDINLIFLILWKFMYKKIYTEFLSECSSETFEQNVVWGFFPDIVWKFFPNEVRNFFPNEVQKLHQK